MAAPTGRAYLTVDDAPTDTLDAKLDVLAAEEVPALLFCEGGRLAEHPEQARRAVERGFHLGNHTYSHRPASDLRRDAFRAELRRTDAMIDDVYDSAGLERPARLFRFPYGDRGGSRSAAFQTILDERGFQGPNHDRFTDDWYQGEVAGGSDWFWTIEVADWTVSERDALAANIADEADRIAAPSADIVLFHDDHNTVGLFADFVELLRDHGLDFRDPLNLLSAERR